jgi:hypothetical protein
MRFQVRLGVLGGFLAVAASAAAAGVTPPAKPAEVAVSVSPVPVAPGAEAHVTVRVTPIDGVKINRYPQIKLSVPGEAGLVHAAQAAVGRSAPPSPEELKTNYFEGVDPVELVLALDPGARTGRHEIPASLTYFYCLPASGFCAPKRVEVTIPLTVGEERPAPAAR